MPFTHMRRKELQLHTFLPSTLEGVSSQIHALADLNPVKFRRYSLAMSQDGLQ